MSRRRRYISAMREMHAMSTRGPMSPCNGIVWIHDFPRTAQVQNPLPTCPRCAPFITGTCSVGVGWGGAGCCYHGHANYTVGSMLHSHRNQPSPSSVPFIGSLQRICSSNFVERSLILNLMLLNNFIVHTLTFKYRKLPTVHYMDPAAQPESRRMSSLIGKRLDSL